MIVDLTAGEAIQKFYQERKEPIDAMYTDWDKQRSIIQQEYSERFIIAIQEMTKMIQYVGWDGDKAYEAWINAFYAILDMNALAGEEPKMQLPEAYQGYGFPHFQHHYRQHYVIYHIHSFIEKQVLRWEALWWIELGNEIGVTDIKF